MRIQAPSFPVDVSLESLVHEAKEGLEAIRSLVTACSSGDTDSEIFSQIRDSGHIKRIVRDVHEYANCGQQLPDPLPIDDLHDLIAFVLTATVNCPLYAKDYPNGLTQTLTNFLSRTKVDKADGLRTTEVECYASEFEYGDEEKLSVGEIALLAGMTEMAVRNATRSDGNDFLKADKSEGRILIKPHIALAWLRGRKGFIPTKIAVPPGSTVDSVMVPFAKDGTFFSAKCERKRGFQVGPKGDEVYYTEIYDALDHLQKMKKAKWRRPNVNGIPGIVSVAEWRPVKKSEFTRS